MKRVLVIIILLSAAIAVKAQGSKEAKFGVDSVKTLVEVSLYQEMYKNKNYKDAYPHWQYVIENAPKFQLTPYIEGNTILKKMYKATRDKKYIDELMALWDQRVKYWGNYKNYNEAYLIGRKGYDLYNYRKGDVNDLQTAYKYLFESINAAGTNSEATIIDRAMSATSDLYKKGKIGKEEVINNFIKLNEIINKIYDVETAQAKLTNIDKVRNNVQQYFILSEAADCNSLQNIFAEQYQTCKNDKDKLLSIVRVLNRFDCTDSQLYANIAESLYQLSPTAEAALSLGIRYLKAKDISQAKKYIEDAGRMETDTYRKANIHYMLATIALTENQYNKTRSEANKALALRPDWGAPKLLVANAYLASANGDVLKRSKAVWAAMDKAAQAKNDPEVAGKAKAFINRCYGFLPECSELFFHGIKKGDSVSVGGWIGGSTTVRCK